MEKDQYTISEQLLDVGDGHQLYIQVWGNPDAQETHLHLHGGPGAASKDKYKTLFDPKQHKVIFFHQRGAGNSTPYGTLENNTTDHLVEDINKILGHLGEEKVIVVGGSWGSALALVYAIRNPDRAVRMVLQGIFTATEAEIKQFEKGSFRSFFPELWERFVASVPPEHAEDPSSYHIPRILGDDQAAAKQSAMDYLSIEGSMLKLDDRVLPIDPEEFDPVPAKIMVHYLSQNAFLPDNYIMDNVDKLTMPIELVQGRYDMITRPETAYNLHKKLANSRLHWTLRGHGYYERETWTVFRSLI